MRTKLWVTQQITQLQIHFFSYLDVRICRENDACVCVCVAYRNRLSKPKKDQKRKAPEKDTGEYDKPEKVRRMTNSAHLMRKIITKSIHFSFFWDALSLYRCYSKFTCLDEILLTLPEKRVNWKQLQVVQRRHGLKLTEWELRLYIDILNIIKSYAKWFFPSFLRHTDGTWKILIIAWQTANCSKSMYDGKSIEKTKSYGIHLHENALHFRERWTHLVDNGWRIEQQLWSLKYYYYARAHILLLTFLPSKWHWRTHHRIASQYKMEICFVNDANVPKSIY